MTNTYTLEVSASGILRTLEDQFTDRLTFLRECLQNSRRSGATQIDIHFNSTNNCMSIIDDGKGFPGHFTDFFTIGQSGWNDESLSIEENPFGIGAASMLFAADKVRIESNGLVTEFSTAEVLQQKPVNEYNVASGLGTRIELYLKPEKYKSLFDSWAKTIGKMVKGFPTPVFLDGVELARPHAINGGLTFTDSDVGSFYLEKTNTSVTTYLQGFVINENRYGFSSPSFVHLDSKQFRARVPDRASLVGSTDAEKLIEKTHREIWVKRLTQLKGASVDKGIFSKENYAACKEFNCLYLLNDLPLPDGIFQFYNEDEVPAYRPYGYHVPHSDPSFECVPATEAEWIDQSFTAFCNVEEYTDDGLYWGVNDYLCENDIPMLKGALDSGHWVFKYLNDYGGFMSITTANETTVTFDSGTDWVWAKVNVCKSITRTIFKGIDTFNTETLTNYHTFDGSSFFVTEDYSDGIDGDLLFRAASYTSEHDEFREGEFDVDVDKLTSGIMAHIRTDKTEVIKEAFSMLTPAAAITLASKSFTITFDESGKVKLVA